jgi:hypothetical protein
VTPEQTEAFPQTPAERNLAQMRKIRAGLVTASEKAEEALERAEEKVATAHLHVMWMNEAIEQAEKADKAARGIVAYEVAVSTGEVSS